MRARPMMRGPRWLLTGGLAWAVVSVPVACAHDNEAPAPVSDDTRIADDAGDASSGEADASPADAGAEAITCSSSKLCITEAPIDEYTHVTSVWGSSATDVWA